MDGEPSFHHGTVEGREPSHGRTPQTEAERRAILQHLERILANPLFKHSKRYPNLLRYVVEKSLEGKAADLKERTLGIQVFGRDPDYDTNADPVVRTTAGEIRKRLAQYYLESGDAGEIRIELPSGSYVPEFHTVAAKPAAAQPAPAAPARRLRYVLALVAVLIAAGTAFWLKPWSPKTAVDRFWAPVLDSSSSVLLCSGQRHFLASLPESLEQRDADFSRFTAPPNTSSTPVTLFKLYYMGCQNVALPDVVTLGALNGLLQSRGKKCQIRGECSTTFADLRNGPVILVGAFNNDWSLRLMGPLRYSFERDGTTFWIKDRQKPDQKSLAVDYGMSYLKLTQDYALISRVFDRRTERMVVVIGGLTGYGTMAAGEFLSTPKYMAAFADSAPRDWERRNIQIVISTEVINGVSGPPRVLDAHAW